MTTQDERTARRRAWQESNPVTPGTPEKPKIDLPDEFLGPPLIYCKTSPRKSRKQEILEALWMIPAVIVLSPIWVPLFGIQWLCERWRDWRPR